VPLAALFRLPFSLGSEALGMHGQFTVHALLMEASEPMYRNRHLIKPLSADLYSVAYHHQIDQLVKPYWGVLSEPKLKFKVKVEYSMTSLSPKPCLKRISFEYPEL